MSKPEKDEAREERITMEIIVDTYGLEERAAGWYCYLGDVISYASDPIRARCIRERAISPLQMGDDVENVRQAVEDWHYWVDRGYEF